MVVNIQAFCSASIDTQWVGDPSCCWVIVGILVPCLASLIPPWLGGVGVPCNCLPQCFHCHHRGRGRKGGLVISGKRLSPWISTRPPLTWPQEGGEGGASSLLGGSGSPGSPDTAGGWGMGSLLLPWGIKVTILTQPWRGCWVPWYILIRLEV